MDAYIVAGFRTPVGKAPRGGLRLTRPDDLAAEVIKHMLAQVPNLDPARVEDLIVGNAVPEAEQGMQISRYIALLSLPTSVPGLTINRYCGSGLEAIAIASAKIHAGMADCIIAGGTESMSMVPMMGNKVAMAPSVFDNDHVNIAYGMGIAPRLLHWHGPDRRASSRSIQHQPRRAG